MGKGRQRGISYGQEPFGFIDGSGSKDESIYLKKSREAFILAVELYNKPTIDYRIEGFSLLFANAWELLLKAKIYADSGNQRSSIMRRNSPRGRLSKTLADCLKKVFTDKDDPVRKNIEYVADLRNDAVHLAIEDPGIEYPEVFQAGVINYTKKIKSWFPQFAHDLLPDDMLALVGFGQLKNIKGVKHPGRVKDRALVRRWIKRHNELCGLGFQGAIVIEHKLSLRNSTKPGEGDIDLVKGGDSAQGFIEKQRLKDPDEVYAHTATSVVNKVNEVLRGKRKINMYDLRAFRDYLGVKVGINSDGFYYTGELSKVGQYSEKFVQGLIEVAKKPEKLKKIRGRFSGLLRAKKLSAARLRGQQKLATQRI